MAKKLANPDKSKPMVKASARTPYTGMIGGPSNNPVNTSSAKSGRVGSFAKGGKVISSKC